MNRPFNGVIDRSGFNFYKLNAEKFSGAGSYSNVSISLLIFEKWRAKIFAVFESYLETSSAPPLASCTGGSMTPPPPNATPLIFQNEMFFGRFPLCPINGEHIPTLPLWPQKSRTYIFGMKRLPDCPGPDRKRVQGASSQEPYQ